MNSKKFQWTVTSLLSAASLFISGIATVNAETDEVKSGDTLSKIALENNTSVENIIASNNLTNEDLIYAGQIIELGERSKSMIDKVAPQEQAKPAECATPVTDGEQGSYAAARMAEMTGVPASTWEAIIARESNGQVNAANASGASGLFQTMPGWGSTATVDDQIQAAYNAYSSHGLSACGY